MKNRIISFISVMFALIIMLSASITVFAADGNLLYTDVEAFTEEEQSAVSDYLAQKSDEVGCDLVCLCIDSFKTYENGKYTQETIEEIANDYYTANKLGKGENGEAVIAVWVDDAEPKIEGFKVYTFGEKYDDNDVLYVYYETINEYLANRTDTESDYYLRCMAFADGFVPIANGQEYVTEVDEEGNTVVYHKEDYDAANGFNWGMYIIIALVIGAVIGLIVAISMKASLKSVKPQSGASLYTVDDSFNVNVQNDVFLYKKEEKTEKPKQVEQQDK